MNKYAKAISAFLASGVSMLAAFNVDVSMASPELVGALGVLLSTVAVYFVRNKS